MLLKAVLKGGSNKDAKTFTIGNVDTAMISSRDDLKMTIREQLSEDITEGDFDVGFVDGSSIVTIQNKEDLSEVWSGLSKLGNTLSLWCDGLVQRNARKSDGRKRVRDESSECDMTTQKEMLTVRERR